MVLFLGVQFQAAENVHRKIVKNILNCTIQEKGFVCAVPGHFNMQSNYIVTTVLVATTPCLVLLPDRTVFYSVLT